MWNLDVQGLGKKLKDVITGLKHLKIEIAVLTETKKKGSGIEYLSKYIHIYSGVPKNERAGKGVTILINKKYENKIHNCETINERLATVNLTIKGHRSSIIGVYGSKIKRNSDIF